MIGPGDYFQAQVNYTEGASRYAALTPSRLARPASSASGLAELGVGWFSDGVYCGGGRRRRPDWLRRLAWCQSKVQLTTAWSVQAAYEHFWTPSLRTSLVGAYTDISYNTARPLICAGNPASTGDLGRAVQAPVWLALGRHRTCGAGSFDWSYYSISSRTQWNITKDFYVGLEGFYGHLNTMSKGQTATYTAARGHRSADRRPHAQRPGRLRVPHARPSRPRSLMIA